MERTRRALILGATGGVGGETAKALARRGWHLRALTRRDGDLPDLGAVDWRRGDAMNPADVIAAAEGCDVILHAVNPPGYRDWAGRVLPMLDATLAAAARHGARIALPGTIYNYGPDHPLLTEDTPQHPVSVKGAIRVEMERRLAASGLPVLILRAGDFFGPHAGNSWFGESMVKPGRPLSSITYPGEPEVGHAWAYLPDVGETFARLLAREADLPRVARFHFAGHWCDRGIDFAEAVRDAAGRPDAAIRRMPWWALRLAAPAVPLFREILEMRYLWRCPLRLDNRRLVDFLGEEPHTSLPTALRDSLAALGCLDGAVRPGGHPSAAGA
ncbi:NAD(P)H-binding protein [Zavarzinia compransoris]|uniref:NAD(P)H-binding protein n=1 Tax=Zavarzinia marina TaxID=2911065 RepID=UPI001F2486FC|nr:NAD(P)H-binding protein [Zavarzinia marina]MCF4167195.1 NAD(P)H-binding protein [Zavarzinia marina]